MAVQAIVTIEIPEQGVKLRMEFEDLLLSTARDAIDVTPNDAGSRRWVLGDVVHFSASGDTADATWTHIDGSEIQ